jgi:hypothetical protein
MKAGRGVSSNSSTSARYQRELGYSADYAEGVAAFTAKRAAVGGR